MTGIGLFKLSGLSAEGLLAAGPLAERERRWVFGSSCKLDCDGISLVSG